MNLKSTHFKKWSTFSALATLLWFPAFTGAQSMPAQKNDDGQSTQDRDTDRQRGTDRQDVARFDQFLDSHREIAEQVRKDPSLLNNKDFVNSHPALRTYLQQNPGVRDQIKQDPNAFMYQEGRYERHEDMTRDRNATRQEISRFDQFLDSHRETAQQLRKNPSLVNNEQFLKAHPALQTYLQEHPAVRNEITQNPNAFMQAEERYDQRENDINRDRDRDAEHNNVARSDRDIDRNANQNARRDSDDNVAANSRDSNRSNSAPATSQNNTNQSSNTGQNTKASQNDNDADRDRSNRESDARRANDIDRNDRDRSSRDRDDRDFDRDRTERSHFNQFLDSHRETAEQLRKDPSLADNPQFLKNHPALQTYLQDHPNVQAQLKNDPNAFMQEQDRFDRDRNQSVARYDRDADGMVHADRDRASFKHSASFGEFLGAHSNMAQQLSKDPSLVKSPAYMEDHPELRSYLDSHPEVKEELMQNPQGFIKSAQQTRQFNGNGQVNSNGEAAKPPSATTTNPTKPKQ